jgi:hypothetical protein
MTVPAELQGRKGDMLAARVITPFVIAMVYGAHQFSALGTSPEHYLYTYVPLLGGLAACTELFIYYVTVTAEGWGKKSWKNLLALLGLVPYAFFLYIIGFLGLYSIYRGVVDAFSVWSIVAGIFWILIGYRGISQFYLMTEIVRLHDEAAKADHDMKVISDFSALMARDDLKAWFLDVAVLPHPKEEILRAIEREIIREPLAARVEWLKQGAFFLSTFQENVRSQSSLLTGAVARASRDTSPEKILAEASKIRAGAEVDSELWQRCLTESDQISSRIAAAVRLREARFVT